MPIRPESAGRYPKGVDHSLAEPLSDLLTVDELAAIGLLQNQMGIDVTRTFQFWEALVATITSGTLTDHKCPWDVELWQGPCHIRIEVKFAQEILCRFADGPRQVFKFADPKGRGTEKTAHVVVLLGIDAANEVHCWVIPGRTVRYCKSITLTSPRVRLRASRSRSVDGHRCPVRQLLPEVLRAYRAHIGDADEHKAQASRTRAAKATVGMDALDFDATDAA